LEHPNPWQEFFRRRQSLAPAMKRLQREL